MNDALTLDDDFAAEEARDLGRYALALTILTLALALTAVLVVVVTGDVPSGIAAVVFGVMAVLMIRVRWSIRSGTTARASLILVMTALGGALLLSTIPPPTPAVAAAPIIAVALALNGLRGRVLVLALVAAVAVSVAAAIIVELIPEGDDVTSEIAAAVRVASMAGVVTMVVFTLYRHRRRLDAALERVQSGGVLLRASEARYRTIVEDVRDVIFRIDAEARWTLLNPAWTEVTGRSVGESIGERTTAFVHPTDRTQHEAQLRRLIRGAVDEYRQDLRLLRADGSHVWVEIHGRVMRDDGSQFIGVSGTLSDITARRALEDRLVEQAFHDDLTGLANRALFTDRLEHALARQTPGRDFVSVIYLDLDRFKTVNDTFGHSTGDTLLGEVAARLRAVLRPEDTIARQGGDEFAILLEWIRGPADAIAVATSVERALDAPFVVGGREITIAASIGVVVEANGDRTAEDLIRDADVAMYRAKVDGRGSYALFEPSMQAAIAARMELESDLRDAIDRDRLTLAYQPIVTIHDSRIVEVEALARWEHPRRGQVPPAVFIPGAEEANLIVPLGRWVLRRACREIGALRRENAGAASLRLSVNVSPMQLADPTIVEDVLNALRDARMPPSALQLEVTESVILDRGNAGLDHVKQLRAVGVRVALDDFGTGYSSLGNLRTMPIDELKVDRTFVDKVLDGGVEAVIVEAVIRLGAALEIAVVAEGIESAAVAARLVQLGCPLGQGYLFGRPQPIADLAALLPYPAAVRVA